MAPQTRKKTSGGYWFFTLFGAVFFFSGLFVFSMPVKDLVGSARAQFWQPAQAEIISAELSRHHGSESTTYKAKAEYSYQWKGETLISDKVMFSGGSDSSRKYHNKIVRELRSAKDRGKPVEVWVNPRKPVEAVLYRGVRWGKTLLMFLFSSLFMGVGGGVMWLGLASKKAEARELERQAAHPNAPWKWKEEWQTRFIKNNNRVKMGFTIAFALFWNAISTPLLFILPEEILEKKNYLAGLGLIFPLVGVALIIWAVKTYRQSQRFKYTGFELDTYPAALGHYLRGTLRIMSNFPQETVFNVTLNHIHKYESGSGDNRTTREDIKWQDEQHVPASAGRWRETYELPIFFALPTDERTSDWSQIRSEYLWRLEIRAELEGADYNQDFVVPVYDPKLYPQIIPPKLGEMGVPAGVYTYQGDLTKTGVILNEEGEGTYYYFPPARHKGSALSLSVMALVFVGIGSLGFFTPLPILFTAIFGIAGLMLAYCAVNFWLYKSAVDISKSEVTLRRGLFKGKFLIFDPSEFSALKLTEAMQIGNQNVYNIVGHLTSGKKIKLAKYFVRKRDAESLLERMHHELGL